MNDIFECIWEAIEDDPIIREHLKQLSKIKMICQDLMDEIDRAMGLKEEKINESN